MGVELQRAGTNTTGLHENMDGGDRLIGSKSSKWRYLLRRVRR
jgi:hypothetical protein